MKVTMGLEEVRTDEDEGEVRMDAEEVRVDEEEVKVDVTSRREEKS
jgi:hypothetical protein